jgi:hypothetical protein
MKMQLSTKKPKRCLGGTLKSIEEVRTPDHVAESVAGQNILVNLRISELLDTAAKLFDRALRQTSATAEESAYPAQELQIRATFRNVKASREDARLKGGARRDSRLK